MNKTIRNSLTLLSVLFFTPLAVLQAAETSKPTPDPSRNPPRVLDASHPVAARVADLLGRMTLEEKIAQLRGGWHHSLGCHRKVDGKVEIAEYYKKILDDPGLGLFGSPLRADPWSGITLEKGLSPRQAAEFINMLQQYLRDHTRLGIPAFVGSDGHRGHHGIGATMFPQLCGMGASFNPALQEEVARAIAAESRSQGQTITYAPNLDVLRDPRIGRCDQNYGEDPWHVSVMGQAAVRGFQGKSLNTDHTIIAMLRAYPGVGDVDGGHDFTGFSRGPIDLHEVVLRPWRDAVLAGAEGIMVEMSEIDAVSIPGSSYYLTELLRNRWGFKGISMDDNFAVQRLIQMKVAADATEASAMAIKAGVDLTLSDTSTKILSRGLPEALKQGLISIEDIDRAVARNLRLKFMLGLFDNPFVDPERAAAVSRCDEHRKLALRAARESIVLLKNERSTLPLNKKLRSIAVIGPSADDNWHQLGDYAPTHPREHVVTVLDGIRAKADKTGMKVNYARGCGIRDMSQDGFAKALDAARRSDVIVAVVGGSSKLEFPKPGRTRGYRSPESDTGEGQTRATLGLLGVQQELLKQLKATGKPLVVVLIHGRAMSVNWVAANSDATVDAWFPGEAGGTAIADVLFGDYNPGGKLAVSVPKHVGQLPIYYYRKYQGKKFVEMDDKPLYPFGFGLSYTTFAYSNLRVQPEHISKDGRGAVVSVDVTNTGKLAGDEVVQLYIHDEISSVVRPPHELKGFKRIHLAPDQTKRVAFEVGRAELCFVDADVKWVVEPGDFQVMIGRSSSEIALKGKLTVKAPVETNPNAD